MTGKSDEDKSNLSGGRAAERLREFIDQRFPNGLPAQEQTNIQPKDEAISAQTADSNLVITEQDYHNLVSIVENFGTHLDSLQQDLHELLSVLKAADSQAKNNNRSK